MTIFTLIVLGIVFCVIWMIPVKREPVKELSKFEQLMESIRQDSRNTETNCLNEALKLEILNNLNDYKAKKLVGGRDSHIIEILDKILGYRLSLSDLNLTEEQVLQWWEEDWYYEAIKHYNDYLTAKQDKILRYFKFLPAMMFKNDLRQLNVTPLAFLRLYRRIDKLYLIKMS